MRQLFAWYDQSKQEWRLSRFPPDAPVRPSLVFESMLKLTEYAQSRRAEVHWHPPLTMEQRSLVSTPEAW